MKVRVRAFAKLSGVASWDTCDFLGTVPEYLESFCNYVFASCSSPWRRMFLHLRLSSREEWLVFLVTLLTSFHERWLASEASSAAMGKVLREPVYASRCSGFLHSVLVSSGFSRKLQ